MFAESLGAVVVSAYLPTSGYAPAQCGLPPIIYIPNQHGPLKTIWELAHEIGHLCKHSGFKNKLFWSKDEAQADRWAACALIPRARIDHHENASIDGFMAALSANYEPLPPHNCEVRDLAHQIAKIRIDALEQGN